MNLPRVHATYFTCSASVGGASRIPPAPADPVGTAETPLSAVAIIAAVENWLGELRPRPLL